MGREFGGGRQRAQGSGVSGARVRRARARLRERRARVEARPGRVCADHLNSRLASDNIGRQSTRSADAFGPAPRHDNKWARAPATMRRKNADTKRPAGAGRQGRAPRGAAKGRQQQHLKMERSQDPASRRRARKSARVTYAPSAWAPLLALALLAQGAANCAGQPQELGAGPAQRHSDKGKCRHWPSGSERAPRSARRRRAWPTCGPRWAPGGPGLARGRRRMLASRGAAKRVAAGGGGGAAAHRCARHHSI